MYVYRLVKSVSYTRIGECEEQSCDNYTVGNCQNEPIINITRASDETACDPIQDGYSHSDVSDEQSSLIEMDFGEPLELENSDNKFNLKRRNGCDVNSRPATASEVEGISKFNTLRP